MRNVEIKVLGIIDEQWEQCFSDLKIHPLESGETLLSGVVQDQAALYGIIAHLRDIGLQLVSVNSEEIDTGEGPGHAG